MATAQVVVIATFATTFTAVCDRCAELNVREGSSGSTFAGRLDDDLSEGVFLCRCGHHVRVERVRTAGQTELAEAS